jgi:hypothetical protein
VTLPASLIRAIAQAVEAQGGDMDDVDDLAAVWERLAANQQPHIDRLDLENRQRRAAYEEAERQL